MTNALCAVTTALWWIIRACAGMRTGRMTMPDYIVTFLIMGCLVAGMVLTAHVSKTRRDKHGEK